MDTAAKYKEYNRLRDIASGKSVPPPAASPAQKKAEKRKAQRDAKDHLTPSKIRRTITSTPQKTSKIGEGQIDTPDSKSSDSPATKRGFVGPTPQKDGRMLGLFDLLDEEDNAQHTPSKNVSADAPGRNPLGSTSGNVGLTTPRKNDRKLGVPDPENVAMTPASTVKKFERTPQSEGRRFLLDKFATPLKRKRDLQAGAQHTPQHSKPHDLGFSTPAFLRRSNQRISSLADIHEEDEPKDDGLGHLKEHASPSIGSRRISMPVPRRPSFKRTFGRSLSSLIADVRRAEDEQLDEELELMKEAEMEDDPPHALLSKGPPKKPSLQVEDSQAIGGLGVLGPDRAPASESDDVAKDQGPQRKFKKKGQKRQTRRAFLRPTIKKQRKPDDVPKVADVDDDEDEDDDDDDDVHDETKTGTTVKETQLPDHDSDDLAYAPEGQHVEESADELQDTPRKKRRVVSGNEPLLGKSEGSGISSQHDRPKEKEKGKGKDSRSTIQKIGASVSSNFRKLKMRGKGGSGKGSFRGWKGKKGRR